MKDKFTKNYVYKTFVALVTLALMFTMGCAAVFAEDEIPKTGVTYTLTYPDGTTVTQNEKGSALTYDDVQKLLKTENWRKMATGLVSGADGKVNLDPSWTKGTIRIVETKVPAGYMQGEESEKTAKLEDGSTTFVNPREDDSTTSGGTKTGDGSKLTLYILTGGVAAAIFAFLAFKKKKVRAGIISMMLIGVFAIGSVYAADGFVINKIDDNGDPVKGAVFDIYGKPEVTWKEGETVTVSGTKTWVIGSERPPLDLIPSSITVRLQSRLSDTDEWTDVDGRSKTIAVTETDILPTSAEERQSGKVFGSWSFENLPKHQGDSAIQYRVVENRIAGFEPTYNGYNITNTYTASADTFTINVSMFYENKLDWGIDIGWGGIVNKPQTVTITNTATSEVRTLTFTPVAGGGPSLAQTVQLPAGTYTISQAAYTGSELNASVENPFDEFYLMRTIEQTITIDNSGSCRLTTLGSDPDNSFYAQYFIYTKKENPETGDYDIPAYDHDNEIDEEGKNSTYTNSCTASGSDITLKTIISNGDPDLHDV